MKVLPILMMVLLLTSCATDPCKVSKEQFIDNYTTLVKKAKDEGRDFSDEKWEEYDKQFEAMTECTDRFDFTMSEKLKMGMQATKYAYYRYGVGLAKELENEESRDKISQSIKQYVNESEDIQIESVDDLEKLFKDLENDPEVKDFFEKLGNKAEDLGDWIEGLEDNPKVKELIKDFEKDANKWGEKLEKLGDDPEIKKLFKELEETIEE